MNAFIKSKISNNYELIAQELKRAREEAGIALDKTAKDTGIGERYLSAMESGRFDLLPQGVYGKNFLREYARYLKLDGQTLLKLLEERLAGNLETPKDRLFSRQAPQAQYFLALPRMIRNLAIMLSVLLCLAYLGYSIKNITAPPELALIYPAEDITAEKSPLIVQGRTIEETEVLINGEAVLPDANGFFSKEINLKNGVNTITVTARRKYSRASTVVRKIILENK